MLMRMRAFRILVGLILFLLAVVTLGRHSGNEPRLDAVAAAQQATGLTLESGRVDVGGVHLHVVQAGPRDGPPVVLLHGFPEFWYAWRDVIPPLVAAGYRVIVPDQRGYGDSDKPSDVEAYRVDLLGDDIAALMKALGHENACVAAHDWGGGVAWNLAIRHPERVNHLVVIDTPHPDAGRRMASKEEKIAWYRTFFQIPYLPEWTARLFHWAVLSKMLRDTAAPGAFPDDKLAQYRSAWDRDGAFGTMVNWYRATHRDPSAPSGERRVRMPTLILLAPRDAFIPSDLARASLPLLDDGRLVELAEGTHWVMQEHPEVVAHEVGTFCQRSQ
jgi:pimeloyl-ACP methyl ester carboxylesterase